jgi:hypothetical protein
MPLDGPLDLDSAVGGDGETAARKQPASALPTGMARESAVAEVRRVGSGGHSCAVIDWVGLAAIHVLRENAQDSVGRDISENPNNPFLLSTVERQGEIMAGAMVANHAGSRGGF